MTKKVKQIKPSWELRLSLQKTTIRSSPIRKHFNHDSVGKAVTHIIQVKSKIRQNALFSSPVKLCMKCKDWIQLSLWHMLCVIMLPPAVQSHQVESRSSSFFQDSIVHLVLRGSVFFFSGFLEGQWSVVLSEVKTPYKLSDKSRRSLETGAPVCPSVLCSCSNV